jgi:ABC-type glycerol-3-phosphate transport system substrate-binding protein
MRMRPLPIFEPGDAPTSTWGGTMLGILKSCKHPDQAWKLAEFLYFSREGIQARRRTGNILPPVKSMWKDEIYQRPDPYFGGQRIEALYAELAEQIPARYMTPATPIANAILSYVVHKAENYVDTHGTDGLEAACRGWLHEGTEDLERRIAHGRFDDDAAAQK